jgi:16S rRNA (uracil1498-N3)-methyltransferase
VVVQALPKGERGELAVEVLTEVGVARIVPWAASRSVAVWKGERAAKSLSRCRATAREAAKQARRPWFPEVDELATTAQVVDLVASAELAVVLHEEASVPLSSLDVPGHGTVVVVVGPEGGLSDDEVAAFAAAGGPAVRLGTEVLRTSTAGVAAVSALLSRTPRWG